MLVKLAPAPRFSDAGRAPAGSGFLREVKRVAGLWDGRAALSVVGVRVASG
jgi:hypothetical protein